MSELNLQTQVTELNLQSALYPWPRMDTADAHRLLSWMDSVDSNQSCADGVCGAKKAMRYAQGIVRARNPHTQPAILNEAHSGLL